jgi:hypothetical protein
MAMDITFSWKSETRPDEEAREAGLILVDEWLF